MQREYLVEDLHLVKKYFPGAKPVALRTPFDLTPRGNRPRLAADTFRAEETDKPAGWLKEVLWTSWT